MKGSANRGLCLWVHLLGIGYSEALNSYGHWLDLIVKIWLRSQIMCSICCFFNFLMNIFIFRWFILLILFPGYFV